MTARRHVPAGVAAGLTVVALVALPQPTEPRVQPGASPPAGLVAALAQNAPRLPAVHDVVPLTAPAAEPAPVPAAPPAPAPVSVPDPAPAPAPAAAAAPAAAPAPFLRDVPPRPAEGAVSALAARGIPATALEAYTRAAAAAPASCHLTWPLLAAIGRVESNHGRFAGAVLRTDGLSDPPIVGIALTGAGTARILDTDGGRLDGDATHDRAVGPMQFIPSTWSRYAEDGDGDGRRDPFNIYDAASASAAYLCAAGGDLRTTAGQARAVFAYNHSASYVATVLELAAVYAGAPVPTVPTPAPAGPPSAPPAAPAPPPAILAAPEPVPAPEPAPALAPHPGPAPAPEPPAVPAEPAAPAEPEILASAETTAVPEPPAVPEPSAAAEAPPAADEPPAAETPAELPVPAEEPEVPAAEQPPTPEPPPSEPPAEEPTPTEPPAGTPAPAEEPVPTEPAAEATTPAAEPAPTEPPAGTPAPVEEPPAAAEPAPIETPAPAEPPAPAAEPAPAEPPAPPEEACPDVEPVVVDVLNSTGDPALAEAAAAHLAAPGVVVGSVTTNADAVPSGITHPAAEEESARLLADALGAGDIAEPGDVVHVTIVLGPADLDVAMAALSDFPGLPAPVCDPGADGDATA